QRVKYTMNIDVEVNTNRFTGTQKLEYTNNSPDKLNKVFYHLYWNAFQPNSMMDARSRELGKKLINDRPNWDARVKDRISKLNSDEIGSQKIKSLKMNGVPQPFKYHETILEVNLTKPILPKSKVFFEMEFEAQVPLQIRRSGRDNQTTLVRYTMTQWYPKLCEYDNEGWHPTPYVAREFYGVWGDYDVTINIDKNYVLGGSGNIANANQVGFGYENKTGITQQAGNKNKWHFIAPNVHDFAWAADPEYKHLIRQIPNGPTIHVLYNREASKYAFDAMSKSAKANYNNDFNKYAADWDRQWKEIADAAVIVFPFIKKTFGDYPYKQYSFIHGGDGGMEYPNCTMLVSPSLGTAIHEWMHSWYQMILATNESMYPWMDEGFTSYAEDLVTRFYLKKSSLQAYKETLKNNPDNKELREFADYVPEDHVDAYIGYFTLNKSGLVEPLTTHADHYNNNYTYGINSYSKGEVFLEQLGYIVGSDVRNKILLEYYRLWKFKHPNAADFMKVAEDVSGLKLDWYNEYWINTTKTIDYGIDSLWEENGVSKIRLKRVGDMPMPIDLELRFKDGTTETHYIPLNLMFGEKPAENNTARTIHEEWRWTHPTYTVQFKRKLTDLKEAEIDASKRMADVERKNNFLQLKW
nr:M1 family metallopeptidase [Chitinophagaceae bacterium]